MAEIARWNCLYASVYYLAFGAATVKNDCREKGLHGLAKQPSCDNSKNVGTSHQLD